MNPQPIIKNIQNLRYIQVSPIPPITKNKYLKGRTPPTPEEKQTLSHLHLLRPLEPHTLRPPPLQEKNKNNNRDPPNPLAHPSFRKEKTAPKYIFRIHPSFTYFA